MKVGIIGTGNVAKGSYLPVLAEMADVDLLYYSRTEARAVAIADQFGGVVVKSMQALMEHDPDTVLVLTNEKQRHEAAMSALEFSPRRLFFEKPLVARQGQACVAEEDFFLGKEIIDTAERKGCETAMVFNYRFFDQTQRAKAIAAERTFGEVQNFTGFVHYCTWSHCIDLLHHFAGPVSTVTALAGEREHCMGDDKATDIAAAFTMANGAMGTILGTQAPSIDCPLFELIFNFERGRIHMRDLDGALEILDYEAPYHEVHAMTRDTSRWQQYEASFKKSLEAYLATVRAETPPPVPGMAGLLELQFEAGLRRSAATQTPVKLDREFSVQQGGTENWKETGRSPSWRSTIPRPVRARS
jgi:predicted dehydrogenase